MHALLDADFVYETTTIDKKQKSSTLIYMIMALPIWLYSRYALSREISRYGTVDDKNQWMVERMYSTDLLLGRTIIVSAKKPTG